MGYYIENKETGKLELYFDKEEYLALSDSDRSKIKSNFLFSRRSGAWISRRKFPNLWYPKRIAEELDLENQGAVGEAISFEEQMKRKAERAEYRAERYDAKAEKAMNEGKRLQKPIDDMHGDIAFFTQPNINSSAGRAFTRQRERMFAMWEKGFDAFKKSDYYADMAETARATARTAEAPDKGFCMRRISEAEAGIRRQTRYIKEWEAELAAIDKDDPKNADKVKRIEDNISRAEEIAEGYISKCIYYRDCIEKAGGINFSKKDVKPGDTIVVGRSRSFEVYSRGPKYVLTTVGCKFSYAEIEKVVSKNV